MKFQVGDRVVLISEYADIHYCQNTDLPQGSTGTVCHVNENRIGVDWDGFTDGHDCDGHSKSNIYGSGYYVDDDELELIFLCENDAEVDISSLL